VAPRNRRFRTATRTILFTAALCTLASAHAADVQWPVHLNAKGYLEDAAGKPFPLIGDAGWVMSTRMNPTEVTTYLDNRQQKGFTATNLMATVVYPPEGPEDYAGEVPFPKGVQDWSERNEAYWSFIDYIITQAKNRGILVFVAPAYLGYQCGEEGWCVDMIAQTNAAMTDYGTWIANRYKSYGNVIWLNGGDCNCNDYAGACARVDAVANGIRAADPAALQTAHSGRQHSALDDYNKPWLNINTTYSECTSYATRLRNDYQRANALPFVYIEGRYEFDQNEPPTAACIDGQMLSAFFGGALLGHVYGNDNVFDKKSTWQTNVGMNSPGATAMGNISRLLKSRKWYELVPDYGNVVVTSGKGSGENYQAAARGSSGETVMIWYPQATTATVNMTQVAGTQARAWWWDPASNTASSAGTFDTTGSKSFQPSRARMVLVLDNAAANLPAPGQTATVLRPKAPTGVQAH
jgi:hypothetical protein